VIVRLALAVAIGCRSTSDINHPANFVIGS
jgi:hypothetical protein